MLPDTIYLIPGLIEDIDIPDITIGSINLKSYQYVKLYNLNELIRLMQSLKKEIGLTQQIIYQEARNVLEDVWLGILDKVDQLNNEISRLVPIGNLLMFMLFSCSISRPQGRKTGLLMKLIGF
jgi:hypothetical protein